MGVWTFHGYINCCAVFGLPRMSCRFVRLVATKFDSVIQCLDIELKCLLPLFHCRMARRSTAVALSSKTHRQMLWGISSGTMTSASRTLGTICFLSTRRWRSAQRLERWLFAGSGRWAICVISLATLVEFMTNYVSFAYTACLAFAVSILLQRQGVCYRSQDMGIWKDVLLRYQGMQWSGVALSVRKLLLEYTFTLFHLQPCLEFLCVMDLRWALLLFVPSSHLQIWKKIYCRFLYIWL